MTDREEYVLGVRTDYSELPGLVAALGVAASEIEAITSRINATGLSPALAQADGRAFATALVQGVQLGLAGARIDLGQFVTGRLNLAGSTAELQAYAAEVEAVAARLARTGLPALSSPRLDPSALSGVRAIEGAANASTQALAATNAQLALMTAQLAALRNTSLPRQPIDPATGELRPRTAAALEAAGARPIQAQVLSSTPLRYDQAGARAQLDAELTGARTRLQAQIDALSGYRDSLAPKALGSAEAYNARVVAPTTVVSSALPDDGRARFTQGPLGAPRPADRRPEVSTGSPTLDRLPSLRAAVPEGETARAAAALRDLARAADAARAAERDRAAAPAAGGAGGSGRGTGGRPPVPPLSSAPLGPDDDPFVRQYAGATGRDGTRQAQLGEDAARAARARALGVAAGREAAFGPTDIPGLAAASDAAEVAAQIRALRERARSYRGTPTVPGLQERFGTQPVPDDVRAFATAADETAAYRENARRAPGLRARTSADLDPDGLERANAMVGALTEENRRAAAQMRTAAATEAESVRVTRARMAAEAAYARAMEEDTARTRASSRAAMSPLARFREDFSGGFRGRPFEREDDGSQPLGAQLGQTARFSVFYGGAYTALRLVSAGFREAIQGAIDFEGALSDLNLATDRTRSVNEALADTLGETGTAVGATAAEGVSAGARAYGQLDLLGRPNAVADRTALQATTVAGQIAFLSDATIQDTLTKLAGLAASFDVPASDLGRIQDQSSVIARASGQQVGDLIAGSATIGTAAAQAGFDLPTTLAAIARITNTTGGTPNAASDSLRQILSRADDTATAANLRRFGVDTEGTTLAEQIAQLSAAYREGRLSESDLNQVTAAFGRGASQQAAQVLITQGSRIEDLAAQGRDAEAGTGAKLFEEASKAVGFQIKELGGAFREVAKDLAETGALDFLYALVVASKETLLVLDEVLDSYNSLPRALRTSVAVILELTAAIALMNRTAAGRAVRDFVASRIPGTAANAAATTAAGAAAAVARPAVPSALALPAAPASRFAVNAAGEAVQTSAAAAGAAGAAGAATVRQRAATAAAGAATAAGAAGSRALSGASAVLLNPATLITALAGAGVIGQVKLTSSLDSQLADARSQASGAASSKDFTEAAAAAKATADSYRQAQDLTSLDALSTLGTAPLLRRVTDTDDIAQAEALARYNTAQAKALEEATKATAAANPVSVFGDFASVASVTDAMGQLEEKGYSAAQRLALLNAAFTDLARTSGLAAEATGARALLYQGQQGELATRFGAAGVSAVNTVADTLDKQAAGQDFQKSLPGRVVQAIPVAGTYLSGLLGQLSTGDTLSDAAGALRDVDPTKLSSAVGKAALDALRARGKDPAGGPVIVSETDEAAIRDAAAKALADQLGSAYTDLSAAQQQALRDAFATSSANALGAFSGQNATPDSVKAYLTLALPAAAQAGSEAATLAGGNQVVGSRTALEQARQARDSATKMVDTISDPAAREQALRFLQQADLAVATAAQQNAQALAAQAASIGSGKASQRSLDDAVGRSQDAIDALKTQRDAFSAAGMSDQARDAATQIRERTLQQAQEGIAARGAQSAAGFGIGNQTGRLQSALGAARERLATMTPGSAGEAQARDEVASLSSQLVARANEIATAAAAASRSATDTRGKLSDQVAAQARIRDAARGIGDAVGVKNAIAAINDLRQQIAEYDESVGLARSGAQVRSGDFVGAAAQQLRAAQSALRTAGDDAAKYWTAYGQLQDAQKAVAEANARYALAAMRSNPLYDITDPVAEARTAVAASQMAVANAGSDSERAEANVQLRRDQAGLEAAQFDQRLNDYRTAEDLGRITEGAYYSYLRSEHDRLAAIANRTRQQQDQLNQVDQLMKSAADAMNDQFNLGDIRLPTVYEVRRAVAAGGGMGTSVATSTSTTNQVTINGADFGRVVAYIQEYLGVSTPVTAGGRL